MSRKSTSAEKEAGKRLEEGINQLAEGRGAEIWVCMEVLGVPLDWKYEELINALHDRIHAWKKLPANRERKLMSAAIKAAAIMLNLAR